MANQKFKIGILTMHCVPNYGAVLQAYATVVIFRRVAEKYFNDGFDIELIDYQPIEKKKKYSKKALIIDSTKSLINLLRNIRNFSIKKMGISNDLHRKFYHFLNSEQCLSKEIGKKNLSRLNEDYDGLVIGSDQVWNPFGMKNDYSYLLSFYTKSNKYSFSSSFGISEFPSEYKNIYSSELKKFKHVAVREDIGLKIYETLTGRYDGTLTLDPALMLSAEDYESIEEEKVNKSFTPCYTLVYLAMHSQTLVKYAKEHTPVGVDVIVCGMPDIVCKLEDNRCKITKSSTIGEFLSLFHNAGKIYTNSFHGIVFSIVYKKDVWIEWNNIHSKSNSRLENIVNKCNLQNRIINEVNNYSPIDYNSINEIIDYERNKAQEYVKQILFDVRHNVTTGRMLPEDGE